MIGAVKVRQFRRLSDEDKVKVDAFMLSNARKELGLERWRAMWKEYLFGLLEEFMEEDRSVATSVYYVRRATEITDETEKVFYIIAYALRRLFEVQRAACRALFPPDDICFPPGMAEENGSFGHD
jgi:hypothetical protein